MGRVNRVPSRLTKQVHSDSSSLLLIIISAHWLRTHLDPGIVIVRVPCEDLFTVTCENLVWQCLLKLVRNQVLQSTNHETAVQYTSSTSSNLHQTWKSPHHHPIAQETIWALWHFGLMFEEYWNLLQGTLKLHLEHPCTVTGPSASVQYPNLWGCILRNFLAYRIKAGECISIYTFQIFLETFCDIWDMGYTQNIPRDNSTYSGVGVLHFLLKSVTRLATCLCHMMLVVCHSWPTCWPFVVYSLYLLFFDWNEQQSSVLKCYAWPLHWGSDSFPFPKSNRVWSQSAYVHNLMI